MNWYYAQGSQQVGPIAEPDFIHLMSTRVVQPTTLVWCERMANWLPLSQVPRELLPAEIIGAPPSSTPGLPPSSEAATPRCTNCGGAFPADLLVQIEGAFVCPNCKPVVLQRIKEGSSAFGVPADADEYARQLIDRDYRVDVGACLSRAWELVKANFWPAIGASLLIMLAVGAAGAIPFIGSCVGMVVDGALLAGLYWYFLKLIRGQSATVGDSFAGFSKNFVQLMLASIVTTILTYLPVLPFGIYLGMTMARSAGRSPDISPLAIVLLVIAFPIMIYLALGWMFTLPLVIDKNMKFWDAMTLSRKIVTHRFWTFVLLMLASVAVAMLGVVALCVGVFVAVPVIFAASMYAYEDIFGGQNPAHT